MEQFISTYQQDYTWPITRTSHEPGSRTGDLCICGTDTTPQEKKIMQPCTDDGYEWSRLGPMGPLLDPKLYPAKTGPYPESDATKFDQPSTYLNKLEAKYPKLYGVLQSSSMCEIVKRVDEDRMRTTYQIDYSDKAMVGMDETSSQPCSPTKATFGMDCQPHLGQSQRKNDRGAKTRDTKTRDASKRNGKKSRRKGEELDGQETRLPPWRSEYQDGISKIGQAIMKTKLHHKQKAAPIWTHSN